MHSPYLSSVCNLPDKPHHKVNSPSKQTSRHGKTSDRGKKQISDRIPPGGKKDHCKATARKKNGKNGGNEAHKYTTRQQAQKQLHGKNSDASCNHNQIGRVKLNMIHIAPPIKIWAGKGVFLPYLPSLYHKNAKKSRDDADVSTVSAVPVHGGIVLFLLLFPLPL